MSWLASVGFWPTFTPAASSASIFAAAVPLPPDTMAPAWPIFLPAGAVTPAMSHMNGFLILYSMKAAASSSSLSPLSPHITTPFVLGSHQLDDMPSRKLCLSPVAYHPPHQTANPTA